MESWISIFCLGVPYARCQGVQPEVPSPSSVALLLRHFVLKRAGMTILTPSALPVCGYRLRLGALPKRKAGPEGPEGKFAEVTRKRRELLNRGSFAHGHGGGFAGLEHRAMSLEARRGAGVIGHAGGDADQDHGDRCDKRYSHDLQVGRAISGDKRMIHGISPRFLSVGRATRGFGSLSNADSSQKFRVDCCVLARGLQARAADAVYVID